MADKFTDLFSFSEEDDTPKTVRSSEKPPAGQNSPLTRNIPVLHESSPAPDTQSGLAAESTPERTVQHAETDTGKPMHGSDSAPKEPDPLSKSHSAAALPHKKKKKNSHTNARAPKNRLTVESGYTPEDGIDADITSRNADERPDALEKSKKHTFSFASTELSSTEAMIPAFAPDGGQKNIKKEKSASDAAPAFSAAMKKQRRKKSELFSDKPKTIHRSPKEESPQPENTQKKSKTRRKSSLKKNSAGSLPAARKPKASRKYIRLPSSEAVSLPEKNGIFLKSGSTPQTIMISVVIALIPAFIWGIYLFGARALLLILLSVLSCVLFEAGFDAVWSLIRRKPLSVGSVRDLSPVVTGLLIGFLLPASAPYWAPPAAAFAGIVIAKKLFGGIGKNLFNPALFGIAVLHAFPGVINALTEPFAQLPLSAVLPDGTASAVSPLLQLKNAMLPTQLTIMDAFIGNMAGTIGEVSALLLLCGGIFLAARKILSLYTAAAFIGTVALLTYLFPTGDLDINFMIYSVFSGSLFLCAVFCASDYSTTPVMPAGKLIFGIGCGALCVLFRYFTPFEEGAVFAVLIMNIWTPLINRMTFPAPFGGVKSPRVKAKNTEEPAKPAESAAVEKTLSFRFAEESAEKSAPDTTRSFSVLSQSQDAEQSKKSSRRSKKYPNLHQVSKTALQDGATQSFPCLDKNTPKTDNAGEKISGQAKSAAPELSTRKFHPVRHTESLPEHEIKLSDEKPKKQSRASAKSEETGRLIQQERLSRQENQSERESTESKRRPPEPEKKRIKASRTPDKISPSSQQESAGKINPGESGHASARAPKRRLETDSVPQSFSLQDNSAAFFDYEKEDREKL